MHDGDLSAVERQIGRTPRGVLDVSYRCPCGDPAVVTTAPVLDDGTPFPTTYYVTCPRLTSAIGTLEGDDEGHEVGTLLGTTDGVSKGSVVGILDGCDVGNVLGIEEGVDDGDEVGLAFVLTAVDSNASTRNSFVAHLLHLEDGDMIFKSCFNSGDLIRKRAKRQSKSQ